MLPCSCRRRLLAQRATTELLHAGLQGNRTARILPRIIFELQGQVRLLIIQRLLAAPSSSREAQAPQHPYSVSAAAAACHLAHRLPAAPLAFAFTPPQDVLEAFQQPSTVAGMLAKEAARHGFDGWVRTFICSKTEPCCCCASGVGTQGGRSQPAAREFAALPSDDSNWCGDERLGGGVAPSYRPPLLPSPTLPAQVFEGWAYWHALGVTQHAQLREAALGLLRQVSGHSVCWYCSVWYGCTDTCTPGLSMLI